MSPLPRAELLSSHVLEVAVRSAARATQCKSNLRQFAICLLAKSSNSPNGRYCSGAFDSSRDGALDQYSWVADCVDQGVLPGQLLCPESICIGSEKWNSKSSNDPTATDFVGGSSAFENSSSGPRTKATDDDGLKNWYLDDSNSPVVKGPLTLRDVDTGDVPANIIPMIGCGSKGDVGADGNGDGILPNTISERIGLVAGIDLAESFDWFAWHSKTVNIVFIDGSVRTLEDQNGDGYINPGFLVPTPTSESEIENQRFTVGYLSPEVETNPFEIFSGTSLRGSFANKKFEQ